MSVTPWEQFVVTGDLVVSEAAEDIREPGLRVDVVELGGLDQGVGDGCGIAATLGADEEEIRAAEGNWLH